ncbi:MAG: hypothetical protein ACJ74J_05810 [Blastocatellia bacterium]
MARQSNEAPSPEEKNQEKNQPPQARGGGGDDRSKNIGPEESFGGPDEGAAKPKKEGQ